MMRSIAIVVLVVSSSLAYADDQGSVHYGRHDFARYCASCHGYAGDGNGTSAQQFDSMATDFTRGVYKCRSTPTGTLPTDDDLRRSIERGLSDSGMPSFVALGRLQIDDLVATLKSFSSRFSHETVGSPIAVPKETPNNAESVARGGVSWSRLKCDNCHGSGRGRVAADATLRNDDGTEAHLPDLTRRSGYRCGSDNSRVFITLMTGLDGTPMSGYAGAISPEEAWDLVHFLAQLRH
jgi:cytochrome c